MFHGSIKLSDINVLGQALNSRDWIMIKTILYMITIQLVYKFDIIIPEFWKIFLHLVSWESGEITILWLMTSKILYSWSKLRHDFLKKKQKLYLQKNRINYGPLLILTNCLRKTEKCYSSDFNPKFVTRNKKTLKNLFSSQICFLRWNWRNLQRICEPNRDRKKLNEIIDAAEVFKNYFSIVTQNLRHLREKTRKLE